jgi:CheY-like chemotaxis protein
MPGISLQHRVILLVDDQEPDVVLTKRALRKSGLDYPVMSVPGGLEALAYLNGDPPYHDRARYPLPLLVLLDVRMPLMDGFEVLAWVRHNPVLSALPVIMLTGSEEQGQAKRARELGATSFLVKSFDCGNTDLFRTVLGLTSSACAAASGNEPEEPEDYFRR